jgi:Fe-S cluster assembly protein SufB
VNPIICGGAKVSSSAWGSDRLPMSSAANEIQAFTQQDYKYGFITDIETDSVPPGLNEEIIRLISAKKNEPEFMLEWRLKAFRHWSTMQEPTWANVHYQPIDYQAIVYYSAPKSMKERPKSLDEVDPELLRTYEKLGIPLREQEMLAGVAVDAVFDSVSVATTFKEKLAELGIIFCSFSEAVEHHPALVEKYLGSVVPHTDNFFAALNSAVFSDGSFCYVPKGVRCPMELSTYFRINAQNTGQFERTLIVADEGAHVSYLEGCTAPVRDSNQLHAAVVELVALDNATIKYSTVQNWYPGDKEGKGGIYNFVTKRGKCLGKNSKISWTQLETGSAITWKYPSCLLMGENSVGEFYSVAVANNYQQADTGTKMIHIGKNTRSTIVSKGISAGHGQNSYRGMVKILPGAENARNYSQCDSMLLGNKCGAHTFPYLEVKNNTAHIEHEASVSRIGEDQIFYCRQRGISTEDAVSMIVNGFCKEVFRELPMEFAVEAQRLLSVSLEGSVG